MTAKTKTPTAAKKLGTIEGLQFDVANASWLLQIFDHASDSGEFGKLPLAAQEAFLQVRYLGKPIEAHAAAIYAEIHR